MKRMFAMARIKRALANYQRDEQIDDLDIRLLKGFYTKDKWELVKAEERESLKFSAKVDRGRARGLIGLFAGEREITDPELRREGVMTNRDLALYYHKQHQKHGGGYANSHIILKRQYYESTARDAKLKPHIENVALDPNWDPPIEQLQAEVLATEERGGVPDTKVAPLDKVQTKKDDETMVLIKSDKTE